MDKGGSILDLVPSESPLLVHELNGEVTSLYPDIMTGERLRRFTRSFLGRCPFPDSRHKLSQTQGQGRD